MYHDLKLKNIFIHSFGSLHHILSPHLLVLATSERFLPAGGTYRVILASESH
jgi:hypothetical protein